MSKILDTLGRKICEYFVSRTSPGEEFVLCIDTYTYELCAAECGFSEKEIDDLLNGKNIRSGADSYYAALAVAALEVKIAFDIETDKDLQDSYNRRLLKLRLANFFSENDVQTFYSYYQDKIRYQDKIWRYSKALFKTKERNLIIPNPKAGSGRYVQYPLYPRNKLKLSGKNIIKFADTFISLGLEPGQALTYEYFCKKVFKKVFRKNDDGEIKSRMIFSFYCLWDGRTFEEIYNKRNYSNRERALQIEKKQIFVQLAPEIKIYINEIQIDLNKTIIDDKFLWKFYGYGFISEYFSTEKGYVFIKDNDYQDWMPCHGSVEPDEELLIITAYCNLPSYINDLKESGEITVYESGQYKFLLLNLNDKEKFKKFEIKLKTPPLISLIGGLKCKRNTYYPFALPTIKVNEEIYGNIFIDGREYPLIDNKCKIPHNLSIGKHSIKLNNSWESSEQKFYIEDIPANLNLEQHGWNINYFQSILEPAKDISDIVVDNITLQSELKWTEYNAVSSIMPEEKGLQCFLQRKNQLESRFSRIGNIRLDKRGKYGK